MACYTRTELMFAQLAHTGRSMHTPEEIDRIKHLDDAELESNYTINKKEDTEEGLTDSSKILVIAPDNLQVNKLEERPAGRANVGSADRFLGQKAPVCIFSLASSSGENTQRRILFLLAKHRTKVELSRSRCLSVTICST